MTLHRGDPVMYRGERHMVKHPESPLIPGIVGIEDDEGFCIHVYIKDVQPVGYTATVDSDGWVRDIEDENPIENREGDPAFNGAFNKW